MSANADRWLLPRRQTEYPTWDLVPESTLHGRREATYLVLTALLLVTLTPLLWIGTSRILDLAAWLPDVELPIAMQLPFGVIPFALGFVAVLLACELYGRRRAGALVAVGAVASAALIGSSWLAKPVAYSPAMLALAAAFLVGQVATVFVFAGLRRRLGGRQLWLRTVVTALVAQPLGWAAFGAAMVALGADAATTVSLATGSAVYMIACIIVAALPLVIAARVLSLFLRVSRREAHGDPNATEPVQRLEPALIVDVEPEPPISRRRAARSLVQPYSSAELRFFVDGEELAGQSLQPTRGPRE